MDPKQTTNLCDWVACSDDSQCQSLLCYEGNCREPIKPLIVFVIVTITLTTLFIIFGVVYLTCHQKRMKKEEKLIKEKEEEARLLKLQRSNEQQQSKPKNFNLKEELEKSIQNHRIETTQGTDLHDRSLLQFENLSHSHTQPLGTQGSHQGPSISNKGFLFTGKNLSPIRGVPYTNNLYTERLLTETDGRRTEADNLLNRNEYRGAESFQSQLQIEGLHKNKSAIL